MPTDDTHEPPTEPPAVPYLRVVRGEPTDEELAALVVAVAALSAGASVPAALRSQWRNRGRNIRPAIGPGPGAWRASGLPR
jgi:hypothetical protein